MNGSFRCRILPALAVMGVLAACAEPPSRPDATATTGLLVLPGAPPLVVVSDSREIGAVGARTEQVLEAVASRPTRRIEPAAAAFLQGTPAGRLFRAATGGRALALGEPPEQCPGLGLVARSEPAAPAALAQDALAACLADLPSTDRSSTPGADTAAGACGCRLLAVNDTLLAPIEAFAHAPGVGARVVGLGPAMAGPLVAREDPEPRADGAGRIVLGRFDTPLATALLYPDGTARLDLADGTRFEGLRERHGWRRGRQTERLLLRDAAGARVIVLLGFEPDEFARDGIRLAAWPPGAPG